MSESAKTIIKYFCDRFLNLDYYPTSIKSILELSIDRLKSVTEDDYNKFKSHEIYTIKDIMTLDCSKLEKISKKTNISYKLLNNSLIAAKLITNAWNKRNAYLKKPQMKVVVAGLDFAGKTSLINKLVSNQGYRDMINLTPTIGANIEEFQTDRLSLVLWDLGGQKNHIDEYLSEPESFFIHVDVLIFVIDSQDDIRYDTATKYLADILNILEFLNENPFMLILINKVDADFADDPDFQIKLEYLTDKITNIYIAQEKSWTFEIIPTSMYNYYQNQPEIARSIKNIFSKESTKDKEHKFQSIEEKLQTILDINLNLLNNMMTELAEIKRIISRIFPSEISKSLISIPFEKVHSEYVLIETKKKSKKKVESPKKKKLKQTPKPPQRLKVIPGEDTPEKKQKSIPMVEIKESQNHTDQNPSIIPNEEIINVEKLKPPPSNPKILSPSSNFSVKPSRKEIISELKEMFIKRGIVR